MGRTGWALMGCSLALACACGGSSSGGEGGSGGGTDGSAGAGTGGSGGDFGAAWTEYCKDAAARDQTCGNAPDEASCLASQSCMETYWRTGAIQPLLSCLTQRDCNTNDDQCFAQSGQAVASNPTIDAYFTSCASWSSQCTGGSNDLCTPGAALLSDATLKALTACMTKPCAEATTCLDPIVTPLDCW